MRIGVAIPCFDKHIPQCIKLLQSLQEQTRRPDMVAVSCSSYTQNDFVIPACSFPIKVLVTDQKQNAAINRNQAAAELDTDIICFFDADDEMHPQRLDIIGYAFESQKTDIFLHSYYQGNECNNPYHGFPINAMFFIRNALRRCISGCITFDNIQRITHGHVSVSREVFHHIQFPEEQESQGREDCVFCYNVFAKPNIQSVYCPIALSKYYPSRTNL